MLMHLFNYIFLSFRYVLLLWFNIYSSVYCISNLIIVHVFLPFSRWLIIWRWNILLGKHLPLILRLDVIEILVRTMQNIFQTMCIPMFIRLLIHLCFPLSPLLQNSGVAHLHFLPKLLGQILITSPLKIDDIND
jgi:hypothetical protein